jgi:putative membrane protein
LGLWDELTGILGTQASLFSDVSLIFQVLATLIFTVGYFYEKRSEKHCIIMGSAVASNVIFVISYMVSRLLRSEVPSPPPQFATLYQSVVIPHGILSVLVLILGVLQGFLAYKWRKKEKAAVVLGKKRAPHRKLGIVTLILWYISLLTGLTVYIILYVL